MLKRICIISSALFALLIFTNTSYSQEAHVGLFISTPHVKIIAGEPVFWPYYHHRHYCRVGTYYNSYYYPHRYYYGYRHDNGRHRGWRKHRW